MPAPPPSSFSLSWLAGMPVGTSWLVKELQGGSSVVMVLRICCAPKPCFARQQLLTKRRATAEAAATANSALQLAVCLARPKTRSVRREQVLYHRSQHRFKGYCHLGGGKGKTNYGRSLAAPRVRRGPLLFSAGLHFPQSF